MGSETLELIYRGQLETLIEKRQSLIFQIEEINNQIIKLRHEAKREGVQIEQH